MSTNAVESANAVENDGDRVLLNRLFASLLDRGEAGPMHFLERTRPIAFASSQTLITCGASCEHYLLVVAGSVRVQLVAGQGRAVTLYQILPGETCVLTTSCMLSGDPFPAEAVAETDGKAYSLSRQVFLEALDASPTFRQFVYGCFGRRLSQMIARIEQVCTLSIDKQLADALTSLGREGEWIDITHQALASKLGTAREVVSRHLKRFELNGWVRLGRGRIRVVDHDALARLVSGPKRVRPVV